MSEISYGHCQCGCGGKTTIAPRAVKERGISKGEPAKFLRGHSGKGKRYADKSGYIMLYMPDHPRAEHNGYVREHVLIAEKAMGKPLPPGAVLHHVNENAGDNKTPGNLVICDSNAYHKLLHQRTRAFKTCGHANWLKCCHCKQYDDPKNMVACKGKNSAFHLECNRDRARKYQRERCAKQKQT